MIRKEKLEDILHSR